MDLLIFILEEIIKAQNIAELGHPAWEKIIPPVLQPPGFMVKMITHFILLDQQIILHTLQEHLSQGVWDIPVQTSIY